jgi:hypothetical protein
MLKRWSKGKHFGYTKWFYGLWEEGMGLYWANESCEFQQWAFLGPLQMGSVKYCRQWTVLSVAASGGRTWVYNDHCSHHLHTSHWLTKIPQIIQHNPHIFFHCITNSIYFNQLSHLQNGSSMFLQRVGTLSHYLLPKP